MLVFFRAVTGDQAVARGASRLERRAALLAGAFDAARARVEVEI
jgi:hypothetical protein